MNNLYEISAQYQHLMDSVMEVEELSEDQLDDLKNIHFNMEEKAVAIASIIKELEDDADRTESTLRRVEQRKYLVTKKIDRLKSMLKHELENCKMQKVKGEYFDITVRRNPVSVYISDAAVIPDRYYVEEVKRVLNKQELCRDLKHNVSIPGVCLEQRTRLDIK